jgi:hypothetical protein
MEESNNRRRKNRGTDEQDQVRKKEDTTKWQVWAGLGRFWQVCRSKGLRRLKRRNQPPQYYKKAVSVSNGLLCTILF